MARTFLPGLIPLGAGLAWGIGHHPVIWRRWTAVGAVIVYLTLAILPSVRRAQLPPAGLRGMAAVMQNANQPNDMIILFRSMNFGLAPYWPELAALPPVHFDPSRPTTPQLLALKKHLATLSPDARVWLAYRDDYYFKQGGESYDAMRAEISAYRRTIRVFWQEGDLSLLIAEPEMR